MRKVPLPGKDGVPQPAKVFFMAETNQWLFSTSVSFDGKRVAVSAGPVQDILRDIDIFPFSTQGNVVTVDPKNGFVTRITSDSLNNRAPCWVP